MEDKFTKIQEDLSLLDRTIRNSNSTDMYQVEQNLKKMRTILTQIRQNLDEVERDMSDLGPGEQKRYNTKLRSLTSEYDIKKRSVNKIDENFTKKRNQEKLLSGELTGFEAKQAERDMIKDLHQETDYQGDIIDDIHNDIKGAHGNLQEVAKEVKSQGEQIDRIHNEVNEADEHVKIADTNINEMNRRNFCVKFMLNCLVVLLFLIFLFMLLYHFLGKKKKKN